jgi:hypothetical protein
MRRMLSVAAVVAAGLIATPPADAAIPQVFTKTATPINCTAQASGQRFCGTGTAQIESWDGIPLDVAVGFPPAPTDGSPDGPYPVIGIYHGWGGTKLSLSGSDAQRALTRGFAVFTMTDRGDPAADITGWKALTDSGGPFDANPAAAAMVNELTANHSAYSIDDSIAPAPALLANGWNDDLFPVDESLRYYNKVRARYPNAPISMFHLDFGHSPRAGAISSADRAALTAAENAWLDYYVKGVGAEPLDARGGVDILTSKCPVNTAGTRYHAESWARLAPGEIRLDGGAAQTIAAPGVAPSNAFTSGDVCTTTASADNASAATYRVPAATSAYTLAGAPTIVAKLNVTGANDMVVARLYDVDGATQRLIARGVQRPLGVGAGPTEQVFQLHPQAWTVQPGHVLKLELLAQDAPYLRTASAAAPQQPVAVSDLQLRLPVVDAPGRDLGNGVRVASPAAKLLPPGAKLVRDYATEASGGAGGTVPATLSLTMGAPASFGAFAPGVDREYTATTTANVVSTAGDAALSVSDPGHLTNGAFALPEPLRVELNPASWTGPVSNAAATITFRQHIGVNDPLRTGSYANTLTFTLSTTNP